MNGNKMTSEMKNHIRELLNKDCGMSLSASVVDELFDAGCLLHLKKKEILIAEGRRDDNLYIVVNGIMRCWYWDDDREKTAFFSSVPTMFLDYHSYFGKEGSFYNYEACTDVDVLKVLRKDFDNLILSSHEFAIWNLKLAQGQLYFYELKHRTNTGSAKSRYLTLIRDWPDINSDVSLQTISSYLGITPQHLSKLRAEIAKK